MKRRTHLLLLLILPFAISSCSSFSKTNRQQRAYQKYVRKMSGARAQQRSLFNSGKTRMPPTPRPGEPVESSESGPQAVPSDG